MEKILILGASGLLGHKLFQTLSARFDNVTGLLHGDRQRFAATGLFDDSNTVDQFEADDFQSVLERLNQLNPNVIVNAVGVTKRRNGITDAHYSRRINAEFPALLSQWVTQRGRRLIHFSTNCVFDGTKTSYTESSPPDCKTTYGSTKAAGEVSAEAALTLRTSFIGRELSHFTELLEWFLAQEGNVISGYTSSQFSGMSTQHLSQIVADIIEFHPKLSGLYNLAVAEPITKYDLLCLARDVFKINVEITPEQNNLHNAVLDGSVLKRKLNLNIPSWQEMMEDIAKESLYDSLNRNVKTDGKTT